MLRRSSIALGSLAAVMVGVLQAGPAVADATDTAGDGTTAAATHGWGSPTEGDEFEGSSVDTSRWAVYGPAPGNAGQGQRVPGQVSEGGGVVTINGDSGGTTGGMNYRTGHKYGRWETRMRVPAGDDRYHPVLLLWPTNGNWPSGGEIDYAETTTAASQTNFFLHYSAANAQTYGQKSLDLTQWHNYAVEWTPTAIVGYVDGVEMFRDSSSSHQPPDIMQQSIQLDWFPAGSGATTPSSMQVAWNRFYPVSQTVNVADAPALRSPHSARAW